MELPELMPAVVAVGYRISESVQVATILLSLLVKGATCRTNSSLQNDVSLRWVSEQSCSHLVDPTSLRRRIA